MDYLCQAEVADFDETVVDHCAPLFLALRFCIMKMLAGLRSR